MGQDKLSLPMSTGITVLEQTAEALVDVPLAQHILVLRDRSHIQFDAESLGYTILEIGDEAGQGMHRSLKLGLSLLRPETKAVMICLGDQPFLRASDYSALLEAYRTGLPQGLDLLYPIRNGHRGNPAILHSRYFPEILAQPDKDQGCRYLFERHAASVNAWQTNIAGFFQDLDTPEDYRSCLN